MLWIVSAAAIWATLGPMSKIAIEHGLPAAESSFWRSLIAWICFGLHAVLTNETKLSLRNRSVLLVFGFVGVSLFYMANVFAVEKAGAGLACILLYSAPVWVAIFSHFLFNEKLTRRKIIAISITIVGVAGVALLGPTAQFRPKPEGILWGLVAGVTYSQYYFLPRVLKGSVKTSTIFLYVFPTGCLGLLPFFNFRLLNLTQFAIVFYLGCVATYVPYLCYYRGLRKTNVVQASVLACVEPVVANIIAVLAFNEVFSIYGYLSIVLVLVGILVMVTSNKKLNLKKKIARDSI
ncbi:MAG: DMT family transporter [Bacteriovoracia bacterium]